MRLRLFEQESGALDAVLIADIDRVIRQPSVCLRHVAVFHRVGRDAEQIARIHEHHGCVL